MVGARQEERGFFALGNFYRRQRSVFSWQRSVQANFLGGKRCGNVGTHMMVGIYFNCTQKRAFTEFGLLIKVDGGEAATADLDSRRVERGRTVKGRLTN